MDWKVQRDTMDCMEEQQEEKAGEHDSVTRSKQWVQGEYERLFVVPEEATRTRLCCCLQEEACHMWVLGEHNKQSSRPNSGVLNKVF